MAIEDGDILKVVMTLDMPGSTVAQNVYHVRADLAAAKTDSVILNECFDWCQRMFGDVDASTADSVDINNVEVLKLTSTTPSVFVSIGSLAGTFVGLVASDALPNGVALVVRAAIEGVSFLARKFIPGIAETKSEEHTWATGALADAANYVVEWLFGVDLGSGDHLVSGVYSIAAEIFRELRGEGAVSTTPGYQRRRKPGVGD